VRRYRNVTPVSVETDLLPALRALPRAEKLRVIHLLFLDLAQDEGLPFAAGEAYPVWSPLDAVEAGEILLRALEAK
jgi:hypothetical protein